MCRPADELRERELRLLATRERPGILERDVAHEPERAEHTAPLGLGDEGAVAQMVDDGRAGGDALVLLRVVADRHAGAEHHLARVVRLDPREDAQQCGLAGAVEPEDEDPLATLQGEREVGPDRAIAVATS